MSSIGLKVRIQQIRWEAKGIFLINWLGLNSEQLPAFKAGAHIDLHMPGDMIRSYFFGQ